MELEEYLKLDREYAIRYSFDNENSYLDCDRCGLMVEIYKKLFLLDNIGTISNCGDTMNTYKSVIALDKNTFPNHDFDLSNRKKRAFSTLKNPKPVISSIKNHTLGNSDHLYLSEGNLLNNHQLGNFIPLPTLTINRQSINTTRSKYPNHDLFVNYLFNLNYFYSGKYNSINNPKLFELFTLNRLYFEQFEGFSNYVEHFMLEEYLDKNNINALCSMDFHKFTQVSNKLIYNRSVRMWNRLQTL